MIVRGRAWRTVQHKRSLWWWNNSVSWLCQLCDNCPIALQHVTTERYKSLTEDPVGDASTNLRGIYIHVHWEQCTEASAGSQQRDSKSFWKDSWEQPQWQLHRRRVTGQGRSTQAKERHREAWSPAGPVSGAVTSLTSGRRALLNVKWGHCSIRHRAAVTTRWEGAQST